MFSSTVWLFDHRSNINLGSLSCRMTKKRFWHPWYLAAVYEVSESAGFVAAVEASWSHEAVEWGWIIAKITWCQFTRRAVLGHSVQMCVLFGGFILVFVLLLIHSFRFQVNRIIHGTISIFWSWIICVGLKYVHVLFFVLFVFECYLYGGGGGGGGVVGIKCGGKIYVYIVKL